jgi:hypothetical protein
VSSIPSRTQVISADARGTVRVRHADGIGEPLILRGCEGRRQGFATAR